MKNNRPITVIFTVILAFALIVAGVYAYRGWQAESPVPVEDNTVAGENPELIGGDKDEHGCLIAAGYSWCEAKQKCLRLWEEVCGIEPAESDIASIKQAFMAEYAKSPDQVTVAIHRFNGTHAFGGVKFSMDGEFGEGGMFLAYKDGRTWKLAFDGNGMYDCALISEYGFPADMTPDCADAGADEDGVACTMDAKICPDGSYVGRVAPDCEFAPCPGESGAVGLPNPAAVYCTEQGGTSEIRTAADGSQSGVCRFADGSECDEWEYFRGECAPGSR